MQAHEIDSEQRSLGMCAGCRPNRHMCSWMIDGEYYCETCADKKRGIVQEVVQEVQSTTECSSTPSLPFQLNPVKTTNVSIGQLETGWVLSYDGENHVFTSKTKLIDKISKLMMPESKKPTPEIPGFEGTLDSLRDLGV